jgi:hypothetical protein
MGVRNLAEDRMLDRIERVQLRDRLSKAEAEAKAATFREAEDAALVFAGADPVRRLPVLRRAVDKNLAVFRVQTPCRPSHWAEADRYFPRRPQPEGEGSR